MHTGTSRGGVKQMEVITGILISIITLLVGALVTRVFSDKKLEKLGGELKEEIKKATTPISDMSKSVLELDKKVLQLIERFSAQTDEMDEVKELLDKLYTRVRELETVVQIEKTKVTTIAENCKRYHG